MFSLKAMINSYMPAQYVWLWSLQNDKTAVW